MDILEKILDFQQQFNPTRFYLYLRKIGVESREAINISCKYKHEIYNEILKDFPEVKENLENYYTVNDLFIR